MRKLKIFIFLFILILLGNLVSAATYIYGAVYDLSLKRVDNARVEINTTPKQFLVAQNGSYSFDVGNGYYLIKAQLLQKNTVVASVQENITVKQSGSYVLDLILFPDIEEGIEEIDIDVNGEIIGADNKFNILIVLVFIVLILIGLFYYIKKKRSVKTLEIQEQKKEEDELEQIIKIIKQEGRRTTQKEIRKQIPLSEAKISLMLAELEHKGMIEKIKKGRGNIIILKKK